ncbi:hypothetical protein Rhopal_000836-T1 [Rhodotorula paludigena]|uniref:Alcohol dehydrogenase-like N-terminal domain-containing protein n=1 Tax=Rhodotorula paludigena TaxID=86838 RepID=A0AAV5GE33_9BASI|nr:hypothetical protein Rhopal_000836-T1 [Rhodotorula paludigena]
MSNVIGTVVRAGSNTKHAVGDRVGVGAQAGSCLECDYCKQGLEQHCRKMQGTYQGLWEDGSVAQGGYADFTRVKGQLAVKIPENLENEPTAPLMCAGVTVYSPLKRLQAGPGKGALQMAKPMGAETYALSHSLSKVDDADLRNMEAGKACFRYMISNT